MPDSSSRPCIAPSSPSLPCRIGSTTSRPTVSQRAGAPSSKTSSPLTLRSGDRTAARPCSQSASGPSQSFQAPRLVIPTKYGSYFARSRWRATSCADLTEIGCSSEQPPKTIPTFNLSMLVGAFELQAVGDGVLDGVAQGMVCVIGGVRADDHIRQLL